MLRKVDLYGYVNIENTAFYLHWSLAGERVEIITRKDDLIAHTVVGEFRLMHPHSEYIEKRTFSNIHINRRSVGRMSKIKRLAVASRASSQLCKQGGR